MPVVSVAPVVDFVTPTYGGRKPMTTIEWTSEQLQPVELAMERMSKQGPLACPESRDSTSAPFDRCEGGTHLFFPALHRSPDRRLRGF